MFPFSPQKEESIVQYSIRIVKLILLKEIERIAYKEEQNVVCLNKKHTQTG